MATYTTAEIRNTLAKELWRLRRTRKYWRSILGSANDEYYWESVMGYVGELGRDVWPKEGK